MKDTLIINLFAGPGAGKSTICADVFAKLKWKGVSCEMAREFAKDLYWEDSIEKMKNQLYVFGNQLQKIKRLQGKVDVVITDSPLLLSIIYDAHDHETFRNLIIEEHLKLNNINYFVNRPYVYDQNGRQQTLEEAKHIDGKIKNMLTSIDTTEVYKMIECDPTSTNLVVDHIMDVLKIKK